MRVWYNAQQNYYILYYQLVVGQESHTYSRGEGKHVPLRTKDRSSIYQIYKSDGEHWGVCLVQLWRERWEGVWQCSPLQFLLIGLFIQGSRMLSAQKCFWGSVLAQSESRGYKGLLKKKQCTKPSQTLFSAFFFWDPSPWRRPLLWPHCLVWSWAHPVPQPSGWKASGKQEMKFFLPLKLFFSSYDWSQ